MERLHLIISGQVQGVFFRAYTVKEAQRLKLTGWVKNRPDGKVEVVAEGPDDKLKEFELWCSRGSPASQVTNVDSRRLPATGEYCEFKILR